MTITITKRHMAIGAVTVIIVAAISASVYFYTGYRKTQALLKNPAQATQEENKKLVEDISMMIDVPEGEEPTIAAVSDKEKLAGQPFFANAENGDRVILYPSIQKAILYRPTTGKIIEMSQVNVGSQNGEPEVASAQTIVDTPPTPEPLENVKVAIFNGTVTPKLASSAQDELTTKYGNIEVLGADNASNQDYERTLVVDLSGTNEKAAADAAELFDGEIGPLPDGENKPVDADLLIILGANYQPTE
ncbi:LytR C-terminal domain-containing protein [Patescibacteria group bacterium]